MWCERLTNQLCESMPLIIKISPCNKMGVTCQTCDLPFEFLINRNIIGI